MSLEQGHGAGGIVEAPGGGDEVLAGRGVVGFLAGLDPVFVVEGAIGGGDGFRGRFLELAELIGEDGGLERRDRRQQEQSVLHPM